MGYYGSQEFNASFSSGLCYGLGEDALPRPSWRLDARAGARATACDGESPKKIVAVASSTLQCHLQLKKGFSAEGHHT